MANFTHKESCPRCNSKDNLARYDDGSAFCFGYGCGHHEGTGGQVGEKAVAVAKSDPQFIRGEYKAIPTRHISEKTCKFFGYMQGNAYNNETKKIEKCHIANYYDNDKKLVGQKLRFPNKIFTWIGKSDDLYGKHLWNSGKYIVITEGEGDSLAMAEVNNCKYPTVSIPHGAASAAKCLKKNVQWLEESFENIVLMFDSDEVGQAAMAECAEIFTPGKCLIAKLSEKDPCDMLKKGKAEELVNAVFRAKPFRPDGIIAGVDVWDMVSEDRSSSDCMYPYAGINAKTYGLRLGELVTVCAGTGIGKSLFCREIAHKLIKEGEPLGYIALEESVRRTALGLMSIEANIPLHLNKEGISLEQLRVVYDKTLGESQVYLYDHWGSLDGGRLSKHIRFMAKALDVRWIILDHVSIVVSGVAEGNERRLLDNTMTSMRSLVEELGIGMILVSHLKRPEGRGHENGAVTSLAQLRGSASIGELSDIVIGLERDQQAEEGDNITTVRILKNRYAGETGVCGTLLYNKTTGRMTECKTTFDDCYGG